MRHRSLRSGRRTFLCEVHTHESLLGGIASNVAGTDKTHESPALTNMFTSAALHSLTACTAVSSMRGFGRSRLFRASRPSSTTAANGRENSPGGGSRNPDIACSSIVRGFGARCRLVVASSSAAEEGSTLSESRSSPEKVSVEMRACYDLVERLGRGAVYLGSARVPEVRECVGGINVNAIAL